jgi:hypothetical protein
MLGEREIAYTPTIDGIPTLLLANDELEAAEALAFAAVHNTKRSSVLTLTREVSLCDLHKIFSHANTKTLRKMVNSTTGLRLIDTKSFSCKVCMLNKLQKQISRP